MSLDEWRKMSPVFWAEDAYLDAADAVAKARVAFAEAFLLRRSRTGTSDGQAREQAVIDTNSELDRALARLEVARRRMDNAEPATEQQRT